jgi:ubiquinone biosynthesis monooxygenase Coq7
MSDRTIARILKVNHAGEFGAIRIYRAQLWYAQTTGGDLVPFLTETLSHEIKHCQLFLDAMPSRNARPCKAMPLWGIGGWILGLATSLMGRNAVMVCTEAVEETVHRHLEEQMHYLTGRDEDLHHIIADIQVEEDQHLRFAKSQVRPSPLNGALKTLICISTEVVIWLSTQGAVTRMERAIKTEK